jgi:phosphate transport system substrate-binding protein
MIERVVRGRIVRMIGFTLGAFWLGAISLAACGEPLATPEPVFLRAAGSTTMAPLVSELAESFTGQSPLVNIDVAGQGTRYGLDELAAGRADMALASWLPANLEHQWRVTTIARDGIAIVVHPSNRVEGLGLLQLQDLFAGRVYEWSGVGGERAQGQVQVVSREAGSGTRDAFESLLMEGSGVTPLAVVAPSSEAVFEYVASHPEAIGYLSMGWASSGVKVLSIEGELPTSESAELGSYPLSRDLWLVTGASPSEPLDAFQHFVLGPAGQQIVGQTFGCVR